MAEEWKPAEETPEAEVVTEEPADDQSPEMSAFIKETADLFEQMKKPPEKKADEEKKEGEEPKADPAPRIAEPATPKAKDEDTGFIKDLSKATPEELKKRIDYLYGKDKHNERLWKDAQGFMQKQAEETERLRAELAKREIVRSEAELDAMQLQVVDLLDRNSPNYNPTEGARLLRELTNRDIQIKEAKEAEKTRVEEFKSAQEKEAADRQLADTAAIISDWSQTRSYAQEGHPLYPHLVQWLRRAYHEAPEHVTVQQIVQRAEQVFDEYVKKGGGTTADGGNGRDTGQKTVPRAPGVGERVTVSQVLGTQQRGQQAPVNAGEKLSAREREVAVKLFYNPEAGISREKAYSMYAEGKD